jgi:hypothetical protein
MSKKSLRPEEKELLLKCIKAHRPTLIDAFERLDSGLVTKEEINEMRNYAVGSELADKGFKPDSEPNEYGLKLDDLIDRLADLYLWPDLRR